MDAQIIAQNVVLNCHVQISVILWGGECGWECEGVHLFLYKADSNLENPCSGTKAIRQGFIEPSCLKRAMCKM